MLRPGRAGAAPTTRGEARALTADTNRPFASHMGSTPILREQEAILGDPEAQRAFAKMRQFDASDAHVQKLIKRVGGTPDSPLPVGGRQQRALDHLIDTTPSEVGQRARALSLQLGRDRVPYVPKDVPAVQPLLEKAMEIPQKPGLLNKLRAAKDLYSPLRRVGEFLGKGV